MSNKGSKFKAMEEELAKLHERYADARERVELLESLNTTLSALTDSQGREIDRLREEMSKHQCPAAGAAPNVVDIDIERIQQRVPLFVSFPGGGTRVELEGITLDQYTETPARGSTPGRFVLVFSYKGYTEATRVRMAEKQKEREDAAKADRERFQRMQREAEEERRKKASAQEYADSVAESFKKRKVVYGVDFERGSPFYVHIDDPLPFTDLGSSKKGFWYDDVVDAFPHHEDVRRSRTPTDEERAARVREERRVAQEAEQRRAEEQRRRAEEQARARQREVEQEVIRRFFNAARGFGAGFDPFDGFRGRPPPRQPARPVQGDWVPLLGFPKTLEDAKASYQRLAKKAHPDQGGSHEEMVKLNNAFDQAKRYFR